MGTKGYKLGPRTQKGRVPEAGTLGYRIWKARFDMGMTQSDIASEAGCDRSTVASIERGANKGTQFNNIVAIAKALDVSLAYMAGESTEYGVYP